MRLFGTKFRMFLAAAVVITGATVLPRTLLAINETVTSVGNTTLNDRISIRHTISLIGYRLTYRGGPNSQLPEADYMVFHFPYDNDYLYLSPCLSSTCQISGEEVDVNDAELSSPGDNYDPFRDEYAVITASLGESSDRHAFFLNKLEPSAAILNVRNILLKLEKGAAFELRSEASVYFENSIITFKNGCVRNDNDSPCNADNNPASYIFNSFNPRTNFDPITINNTNKNDDGSIVSSLRLIIDGERDSPLAIIHVQNADEASTTVEMLRKMNVKFMMRVLDDPNEPNKAPTTPVQTLPDNVALVSWESDISQSFVDCQSVRHIGNIYTCILPEGIQDLVQLESDGQISDLISNDDRMVEIDDSRTWFTSRGQRIRLQPPDCPLHGQNAKANDDTGDLYCRNSDSHITAKFVWDTNYATAWVYECDEGYTYQLNPNPYYPGPGRCVASVVATATLMITVDISPVEPSADTEIPADGEDDTDDEEADWSHDPPATDSSGTGAGEGTTSSSQTVSGTEINADPITGLTDTTSNGVRWTTPTNSGTDDGDSDSGDSGGTEFAAEGKDGIVTGCSMVKTAGGPSGAHIHIILVIFVFSIFGAFKRQGLDPCLRQAGPLNSRGDDNLHSDRTVIRTPHCLSRRHLQKQVPR